MVHPKEVRTDAEIEEILNLAFQYMFLPNWKTYLIHQHHLYIPELVHYQYNGIKVKIQGSDWLENDKEYAYTQLDNAHRYLVYLYENPEEQKEVIEAVVENVYAKETLNSMVPVITWVGGFLVTLYFLTRKGLFHKWT